MVFLFSKDAEPLLDAITEDPGLEVTLKESHGKQCAINFQTLVDPLITIADVVS